MLLHYHFLSLIDTDTGIVASSVLDKNAGNEVVSESYQGPVSVVHIALLECHTAMGHSPRFIS